MASKLDNSAKNRFVELISSRPDLEDSSSKIASFCKFNFNFLDCSQEHSGQLNDKELISIITEKLFRFSQNSLSFWKKQKVGPKKTQAVLEIYGTFPTKSNFSEPKSIPHQAQWARFRIDSKKRLIGFVIPDELNGKEHPSGYRFDTNTFYIVFLDPEHNFYITRKK